MTTIIPQCVDCIHLSRDTKPPTCTAFPDGIPMKILTNEVDHRELVRGDHGIQFVAMAGRESVFQGTRKG